MEQPQPDFTIARLGECRIPTPMQGGRPVGDDQRILLDSDLTAVRRCFEAGGTAPNLEKAGPREKIYFDPSRVRCGIVTCGGLCPGLNDVIRSIVLSLHYLYGVRSVIGFRFGYEGLTRNPAYPPMDLNPDTVRDIFDLGGTILGSSRGNQDIGEMVDTLERLDIDILFTLGGDGTLRGAQAIAEEALRRGRQIAVIGIPKTIDNDISYVQKSFGFETAVAVAKEVIAAAHTEATGARNGIGLVKLMGRESGFIASYSVLVDSIVNFCLIPEVPFAVEALARRLQERLERRGHAVIVVAEGAGQDLIGETGHRDASGNIRYKDIGLFLKDAISEHFRRLGIEVTLKYIDPSYTIRSVPTNAHDSAFCLLLGHCAVHAGMAGRTNMVVSSWNSHFVHVPIPLAVSKRQKVDPEGALWGSVLSSTGQPRDMR